MPEIGRSDRDMSDVRDAVTDEPAQRGAPVALAELTLSSVWNVRGDPAEPNFLATAERVFELPLPLPPNSSARRGPPGTGAPSGAPGGALLALGPAAWLYLGRNTVRGDFDAARKALNAVGGALFDVSASYAGWSVTGTEAARALNRRCPLDLHPRAFPAGHCAQSLLGHVNALFWRPDESAAFIVLVARSFAADAWRALQAICGTTRAAAKGPPRSRGR